MNGAAAQDHFVGLERVLLAVLDGDHADGLRAFEQDFFHLNFGFDAQVSAAPRLRVQIADGSGDTSVLEV